MPQGADDVDDDRAYEEMLLNKMHFCIQQERTKRKKTSNEMVSLSKKDPRGLLLVLGILGICTCEQPIILIKTIYTKIHLSPFNCKQNIKVLPKNEKWLQFFVNYKLTLLI